MDENLVYAVKMFLLMVFLLGLPVLAAYLCSKLAVPPVYPGRNPYDTIKIDDEGFELFWWHDLLHRRRGRLTQIWENGTWRKTRKGE